MSTEISYTYTNSTNYTFNSSEISISSGVSLLYLQDKTTQTYIEAFGSSATLVFDDTFTELSSGIVQQIDKRPSNATFYASFATNENANWCNGLSTGILYNGAVISSSELDCTGGSNKYCEYDAENNADFAQTGCVRILYKPNYSGTPSANRFIFSINKGDGTLNNVLQISHLNTGNILLSIYNDVGSSIMNINLGGWSPVADTEYEFEINYDLTAGATRLFVDGSQFGATQAGTGTRASSNINKIYLGTGHDATATADCSYGSILIFSVDQHTTNYTPDWSNIYETIYRTDTIELTQFSYSGAGSIQEYTTFTNTLSNVKFTLNNQYWDGSSWSTSANTWAQANLSSDINTNLSTFSPSSTLDVKVITNNSSSLGYIDNLQIEYTGQKYSTNDPTITTITTFRTDGLVSFTETSTYSTNTAIKHILTMDSTDYYYSGSSWAISDGTYAQSNLSSDINSNSTSLIDDNLGKVIAIKTFLHADVDTETPQLNQTDVIFELVGVPPTMTYHTYYGVLKQLDNTNLEGKTIQVRTDYLSNSNVLITDDYITATVRSDGYWEIDVYYEDVKPSRLYWYLDNKKYITNFTTATNQFSELRRYRG